MSILTGVFVFVYMYIYTCTHVFVSVCCANSQCYRVLSPCFHRATSDSTQPLATKSTGDRREAVDKIGAPLPDGWRYGMGHSL